MKTRARAATEALRARIRAIEWSGHPSYGVLPFGVGMLGSLRSPGAMVAKAGKGLRKCRVDTLRGNDEWGRWNRDRLLVLLTQAPSLLP
jgi:hypothetical protein